MNVEYKCKGIKMYIPFQYCTNIIKTLSFPHPSKLQVKRGQICCSYSVDITFGPDRLAYIAEAMSFA